MKHLILISLILLLFVKCNAYSQSTSKDTITILGEVFTTKGKSVDLKHTGSDIKIGETLYIFQDGKPVSQLTVTQTFHTKVQAKVVKTSVVIKKGMSFGKWTEGKKEAAKEEKEIAKPIENKEELSAKEIKEAKEEKPMPKPEEKIVEKEKLKEVDPKEDESILKYSGIYFPIGIALWTPISINDSSSPKLVQANLIYGESRDIWGANAGFANHNEKNLYGLQVGGLMSRNMGNLYGLQIGGLMSINGKNLYGLQIAGFMNANSKGDLIGIQLSPFTNAVGSIKYGIQTGCFNYADENSSGIQIGVINAALMNFSLQWGALNTADESINYVSGKARLQVGVLNIAWKNPIPILPIVNFDF